jgi:hypothetical protein
MKTLIKMTDYLPDNPYSKFLKQTPQIWMFVACKLVDGVWVVLELPKVCICTDLCSLCKEYQQAKERCYFDGWEYDGMEEGFIYIKKDDTLLIFDTENKTLMFLNTMVTDNISTIEDLIPYNLTLTATAQKEIV